MDWKKLNNDIIDDNVIGNHGAENSDMYILTLAIKNIDIEKKSKKKVKEEYIDNDLESLIRYNSIHKYHLWEKMNTINPVGLWSSPSTIACVRAKLDIKDLVPLKQDGLIVDKDNMVHCLKIAIHYSWSLKGISKRLSIDEKKLRDIFYKKIKNPDFLDFQKDIYLPTIPGISIFIFGDIRKLNDESTEVTVRIHDQCLNSDCFRGTICTCAPYLFWAIDNCIQTAQRGGVGIIFYFKKEGRSMGEVIKFRVYSSRKENDCSKEYFHRTTNIAGIEDIRFQEFMPDPLLWLGITKIDHLYSMSNLKYNSLIESGIHVKNRYDIPKEYIHPDAKVEITAKINSGYHTSK